jgi:hypothetical protein
MITAVHSVRQTTGKSCRRICRELGVGYSSLMRWQHRRQAGAELVRKPGPPKAAPLDLAMLGTEIRQLAHGRERTRGTGALYVRHREAISRRDLQALVAHVRDELHRAAQALTRQIDWLVPGVIWSMDDAAVPLADAGHMHLHVVHDLGSRFTLRVLGDGALADGPAIVRNLADLFRRYGAPLFFKRDNGSNLNHTAVTGLLGERGVIPLNSPSHYPPYNGGMEHKQGEIKKQLGSRFADQPACLPVLRLAAEICGHDLNHLRRPVLGNRTACQELERGRPFLSQFHRRERKEVLDEIKELAVDIESDLEQHNDTGAEVAFRYAAETWMQCNHIINVRQNGRLLPPFYRLWSH